MAITTAAAAAAAAAVDQATGMDVDSAPAPQDQAAAAAGAAAATNGSSTPAAAGDAAAAGNNSTAQQQQQQQQSADAADAAAAAAGGAQPKKQTKRKVAMHLAYLGAGYYGMQRNPNCVTIESELEGALTKAGAISKENAGSFHKIHWNRAARTDKGVSAVCQVVSAKLMIEPKESFAERVNQHLPPQVRVFGVQRATEGFDARKFCDRRKYEYILPAWVFDPQAAAAGRQQQQQQQPSTVPKKGSSSARLADEAAALQAIAAAVLAADLPTQQQQQQHQQPAGVDGAAGATSTAEAAAAAAAAAAAGGDNTSGAGADAGQPSSSSGGGGGGASDRSVSRQESAADELASTSKVDKDVLARLRQDIATSRQRYVFGASQLSRLNALLGQYEGTHNYHNFTVRTPWNDPAAGRYILSFRAEPLDIQGSPWVRLVVVGQSFMLHQIRKMVGMVLAIMRGVAPEECLRLALDADRDIHTPMAPELGLFLDETYYEAYNNRFGELHGPITFEPYRQAATEFKETVLYNHIAALDEKELVNALWLRGCTDMVYRFSSWSSRPKARNSSGAKQQQQAAANGQDHKRKQEEGAGGAAAAVQQQQPVLKQQRLERPGKLEGASAAMVVGMQETYSMRPHSDTQQAAEFRRELKEMRDEYAQVQQAQQAQAQVQQQAQQAQQQQQAQAQAQQQQPLPEVAEEELDSLYE